VFENGAMGSIFEFMRDEVSGERSKYVLKSVILWAPHRIFGSPNKEDKVGRKQRKMRKRFRWGNMNKIDKPCGLVVRVSDY
jgi:hypothetical protein